jgi:large subunit ribosomal protein L21
MYAVIMTGGKQYRIKEGDLLSVEKLGAAKGDKVHFDQVLLIEDNETVTVGTPIVEGALVRAEVVEEFKDDKVVVFKKKRRKQYRRTRGHRQELTKVIIERIVPDLKAVPEEELRLTKAEVILEAAGAEMEKEAAVKKKRAKKQAAAAEKAPAKTEPLKKAPVKAARKPKKTKKE